MTKIEQAAPLLTKGGGSVAVLSGVSRWLVENADLISAIGVVTGIVGCLLGYVTQLVFQIRRDRREARLQEKRMAERWGRNNLEQDQ